MKYIIALIALLALPAVAQTTVSLGSVTLTQRHVNGMTWHWQNYTNSMGTNAYLSKVAWFQWESTNGCMANVERKTQQWEADKYSKLAGIWATNETKRIAIQAILDQ